MNDANFSRNDAGADGPDRRPRPEDPAYGEYDAYGRYRAPGQQPPQQEGRQDQGGYDPYAAADPYGQGGYAYDPYAPQQAQTGYADPYAPGYAPDAYGDPQVPRQGYREPGHPDPGHLDPGHGGGSYGGDSYGDGAYGGTPYGGYGDAYSGYQDPAAQGGGYAGYDTGTYPAARPDPAPDGAGADGADGDEDPYAELAELSDPEPAPGAGTPSSSGTSPDGQVYETGQFAFVDDQEEDAEVIDWLKFAETRTERRDERRRRLRSRLVGLVLAVVLVAAGGVGYLWWQGKPPFGGSGETAPAAAGQKRDVILLHLMDPDSEETSTALLVDNETTGKGTTVLLPNALAVSTEDSGSTTLGQSVDGEGVGPTRDSLSTLLGADIKGSWRLDTPFLELLVESLGGITVDTDTAVEGTGKDKGRTVVKKGADQELRGPAAVAYATHRASGEDAAQQLARFGQVVEAILKKVPSDPASATTLVERLGMVADPSLPEKELGASLAPLAEQAQAGEYRTVSLSVEQDGTLAESTTKELVEDVLGGTVKNTDPQATPRVSVRNATGDADLLGDAQAALANGGYTFAPAGDADETAATSRVEYVEDVRKETAAEVAATLGLPESAVRKVDGDSGNLDITVVLGQDFDGAGG